MKSILNFSYQLCNYSEESIYHLLDSCLDTLDYRN